MAAAKAAWAVKETVPVWSGALVSPDGPLPFDFDIAVGVRKGDRALRDEVQGVLERRRDEVRALLDAYGVPRAPAPGGAGP
ncbi:MAG TPA: hypothetical protein VFS43_40435 [Polyangiaceae bacterium]|nr:hypothetical protein [Polyangiaceae bacterium]